MILSEIKHHLQNLESIAFQLPNGALVSSHFHVTEVGKITKDFIDCGGTVRNESVVNFQLWKASDYDHKLHPKKLLKIIETAEKKFQFNDLEIEVEYQGSETIGKYSLDFDGENFLLKPKVTACLALDACGIPKPVIKIANAVSACCNPSSGCC